MATVRHRFLATAPQDVDRTLVSTAEWNDEHDIMITQSEINALGVNAASVEGRPSVLDYEGSDYSDRFQAAIHAEGRPFVPAGNYTLPTPLVCERDGSGLDGAGSALVGLACEYGLLAATPNTGIDSCSFSGLYVSPTATVAHANGQHYRNATAIDFTGISFSTLRDVYTKQWQTHLMLDYAEGKPTYKNHIENFRAWGGEVGLNLGGFNNDGSAIGHDGANANKFFGISLAAMKVHMLVRGGLNSFFGTRIENSSQAAGYPLTSIGVQFDSGYYGVSNNFTDTYCELAGSGNKGIYVHDSALSGGIWLTPNRFVGGSFSVNGLKESPTFDAGVAAVAYGLHLDVQGLYPTRLLSYSPDGTAQQLTYKNGGGVFITTTAGVTLYDSSI